MLYGPDGLPIEEPVDRGQSVESQGSAMTERESLERVRECLKMASDAASHLAYHQNDHRWGIVCAMLDKIRADGHETEIVHSSRMSLFEAFNRHVEGLKQASAAARQVAVYHRVDEKWLKLAHAIEGMKDKAFELARRRKARANGLILL